MLLLFIFFIMFSNVITANDEHNKYIDLLPEEEKKAFLDRIARRILEEIKSKKSPNAPHVQISDEQLDAQTAFVQGILKEESENLRKKRRNSNNENIETTVVLNRKNEEDLTQDRFVDLTLRTDQQNRRSNGISNTESTSDSNYVTIAVETIYNSSDENIYRTTQKTLFETDANMNSSNSDLLYKQNILSESVINPSINDTHTIIAMSNDANTVENNSKNVDYLSQTTTFTLETENLMNDYETTEPALLQKIYDTGKENSNGNNNSSMRSSNDTNESKITYLLTTSTKPVNTDSLSTPSDVNISGVRKNFGSFSTDSGWTDTSTTKTENVSETNVLNVIHNQSQNRISNGSKNVVINKATKNKRDHNNRDSIKSIKKNLHMSSVRNELYDYSEGHSTTNSGVSVSTTSSSITDFKIIDTSTQTITKGPIKLKDVTVDISFRTENDKNLNVSQINNHNDEINQLKVTPPKNTSLRNLDDLDKTFTTDKSKLKVYDVYEIDPSDTPFVVNSPKPKKDRYPHYVPVYNYDHNNAYINTYTRFGNLQSMESSKAVNTIADSKEFILANNEYQDISRSLKSKLRNILYQKAQNKKKRVKTIKYNDFESPNINFNPILQFNSEDYIDLYLKESLRNKSQFPNTDDENHPYNLLQDKNKFIKNHLQAVRYVMYLNKIYELIPPHNASSKTAFRNPKIKTRAYSNGESLNSQENEKNPGDSIAIDYYFGRQGSNEDRKFYIQDYRETENHDSLVLTETPLPYVPQKSLFKKSVKDKEINDRFDNYKLLITVLRDMVKMNYRPLKDYQWIKTAVDIRTGMAKVLDLIHRFHNEQWVHPKDLELLKYVFFLFEYSKQNLNQQNDDQAGADIVIKNLRKKSWFPKKKRRIKRPLQMIKDVFSFIRDTESDDEDQPLMVLQELEDFFNEVTFHLDVLHHTLKIIAETKTYRTRNVYGDLKHIYLLNASDRELLGVIIHLATYKALTMIEYSAGNGMKDGFVSYVKKNRDVVNKTRDELLFVLNLIEILRVNVRK